MRPCSHAAAGVVLGGGVYAVTGEWRLGLAAGLAEALLDVDHLIEHLIQSPKPWCPRTFLARHNALTWPRMFFVLHSYEFMILIAVLAWWAGSGLLGAAALGFWVHLLLDEFGNRLPSAPARIHPAFYCLTWRLTQGCRTDRITDYGRDT